MSMHPVFLWALSDSIYPIGNLVGQGGFEPPTFWSRTRRASPCATARKINIENIALFSDVCNTSIIHKEKDADFFESMKRLPYHRSPCRITPSFSEDDALPNADGKQYRRAFDFLQNERIHVFYRHIHNSSWNMDTLYPGERWQET